jgi:hypothetical protein
MHNKIAQQMHNTRKLTHMGFTHMSYVVQFCCAKIFSLYENTRNIWQFFIPGKHHKMSFEPFLELQTKLLKKHIFLNIYFYLKTWIFLKIKKYFMPKQTTIRDWVQLLVLYSCNHPSISQILIGSYWSMFFVFFLFWS